MSVDPHLDNMWTKAEEANLEFVATVRLIETKYGLSEEDATKLYVTSDNTANAEIRYFRSLDEDVVRGLKFVEKLKLLFGR